MAEPKLDPFVSTEEVEVDAETAAAIQRGLDDVEAGRVVSIEEARRYIDQWHSSSSSPTQP